MSFFWELFKISPLVLLLPIRWDAFILPEEPPFFLLILSIEQLLIFDLDHDNLVMNLALCYDPYRRHELWRMVTVMLVHSSPAHVLRIIDSQVMLGLPLEIVQGCYRTATVYVGGVLGGSLAATVLGPQEYAFGATAGVYAIILAHLATIILNWNEMDCRFARLFWILALIAYLGKEMYIEFFFNATSRKWHAANLGGAVAGFIIASLVFRLPVEQPWKTKFQEFLRALGVTLVLVVVIINVALPSHFQPSQFNFNYTETFLHDRFKKLNDQPQLWSNFQKWCLANEVCAPMYQDYFNSKRQTEL